MHLDSIEKVKILILASAIPFAAGLNNGVRLFEIQFTRRSPHLRSVEIS